MQNITRARPIARDWFTGLLHLMLALAFIPMAVFLATPHKTNDPMSFVVSVITEMTGTAAPATNNDDAVAQETMMSATALLHRWDPLIAEASRRFGVPADWIRAVMRVESGGRTMLDDKPITSRAGAVGIMQVMPGTYDEMAEQYGLGADRYNPHDNVFAGAAYLRWLHDRYGFPDMFAAYNGGPGTLEANRRGDEELPKETRNYLASVTSILDASHRHAHARG